MNAIQNECLSVAFLKGKISTPKLLPTKDLSFKIYTATLEVKRPSGVMDYVPIYIHEKIYNSLPAFNTYVKVVGSFRNYNKDTHVYLAVWAKEITYLSTEEYENEILLKGYICKTDIIRQTALTQKTIYGFWLKVQYKYRKFYLPIISWYKNAELLSCLGLGDFVSLKGRIQSRDYEKKYEDGRTEIKTAYEVCCLEICLDD